MSRRSAPRGAVRFEPSDVPPLLPLWLGAGLGGCVILVVLCITLFYPLADKQEFRGPLQHLPQAPTLEVAPGEHLARYDAAKARRAAALAGPDRPSHAGDRGARLGAREVKSCTVANRAGLGLVVTGRCPNRPQRLCEPRISPAPWCAASARRALARREGRAVVLGSAFDGRPTILVLEYLRCQNLCSLVLSGTTAAMAQAHLQPGKNVNLVAISIDPATPPPTPPLRAQCTAAASQIRKRPLPASASSPARPTTSQRSQAQSAFPIATTGRPPIRPSGRLCRRDPGRPDLALHARAQSSAGAAQASGRRRRSRKGRAARPPAALPLLWLRPRRASSRR